MSGTNFFGSYTYLKVLYIGIRPKKKLKFVCVSKPKLSLKFSIMHQNNIDWKLNVKTPQRNRCFYSTLSETSVKMKHYHLFVKLFSCVNSMSYVNEKPSKPPWVSVFMVITWPEYRSWWGGSPKCQKPEVPN